MLHLIWLCTSYQTSSAKQAAQGRRKTPMVRPSQTIIDNALPPSRQKNKEQNRMLYQPTVMANPVLHSERKKRNSKLPPSALWQIPTVTAVVLSSVPRITKWLVYYSLGTPHWLFLKARKVVGYLVSAWTAPDACNAIFIPQKTSPC